MKAKRIVSKKKVSSKLTLKEFDKLARWIENTGSAEIGPILNLYPLRIMRKTSKASRYLQRKADIALDRAKMLNATRDQDLWHIDCSDSIGRTLVKSIDLAYRSRLIGVKDV